MALMTVGLAATLAGCGSANDAGNNPPADVSKPATPSSEAPPPPLPPIPPPHAGPSQKIDHGIPNSNKIILTVDDGYNADCVAGYVKFAKQSGIHLTFSPNGTYGKEWAPHADVIKPLLERKQVQIINHTFSHHDLTKMTDAQITTELERNDEWVRQNFGITTRPYYRPPFGFHNAHVDGLAGSLGYTRMVLWNGSYSDSEVITPDFLMQMARQYLKPGVIMLGHANHSTVLSLFPQILDLIKQRNLDPVTLDEMFGTSRATG
ncbi:MAG TPA: polysaccharide deacetylase family protein [Pseudonocardiaceae bacterium]|jgi:peptidoglycan/xylan/chitin deacetylase (PgdA/CDA1 family)